MKTGLPFSDIRKCLRMWLPAVGMAVLALGKPGMAQQAVNCDIGLVLALDVSGSVTGADFGLQTNGIAEAFEDPELVQLLSFYEGGVMVAAMQWSGERFQELSVNWTPITSPDDAYVFARKIRTMRRGAADLTATGSALNFANDLFRQAPADCRRKVIDVSTDGLSNRGPDLLRTADAVAETGTVINALVIFGDSPSLVRYFETALVRGAGSFSHAIASYSDYPEAIKRKLLRELRPDVATNGQPGAKTKAH